MTGNPWRHAANPQPGATVLFRWRGAWVRGLVVGEGDELRLPLRREDGPGLKARRIYWRNRTQLFEIGVTDARL